LFTVQPVAASPAAPAPAATNARLETTPPPLKSTTHE